MKVQKNILWKDGVTLAKQGAEIARAESAVKAERVANGTKLSAAMEEAMQQASDAGCRVPGNCREVNHDLKQTMQVASAGQAPKELGGRH